MTTWRHFNPKPVKAWNVEALAQGTPNTVKSTDEAYHVDSILRALPGLWRDRKDCAPDFPKVGDFAMLDGRIHRIMGITRGWRSRRPRYELQDVAEPDMPRHSVAWSEIERVARITQDPSARRSAAPPK